MNRMNAPLSLALLLGAFAASLPGQNPAPATEAKPQEAAPVADAGLVAQVGVVDVDKVLDGYPKAREMKQRLAGMESEMNATLQQYKDELTQLKLEVDGWDQFTTQWADAQAKFEGKKAEAQSRRELLDRTLLFETYKVRDSLYRDIDRAVQELARKRKLLLVLPVFTVRDDEPLETRVPKMASRSVLYHESTLDLTEDVINLLMSPEFVGNGASRPGK